MATKTKAKSATTSKTKRLAVKRSGIHGRGVFATERIRKGERLIEYTGEVIDSEEGDERYPWIEGIPYHTFLFRIRDDHVIDGGVKGSAARWINHSCDPNCETIIDDDDRIWIESIRTIRPGEELTYDYHLITADRHTPEVKRRFPCYCGTKRCRGTMLVPKRG
jgi:hypothetical protein